MRLTAEQLEEVESLLDDAESALSDAMDLTEEADPEWHQFIFDAYSRVGDATYFERERARKAKPKKGKNP